MAHTYGTNYVHAVFATKNRASSIAEEFRSRLWKYLSGIARANDFAVIEVGGTEDHIHLLLSLPPTLTISKAVQLLKGGSSKWVQDTFPTHSDFGWQEGFGYFSVSFSGLDRLIRYIQHQPEHHRSVSYADEWRTLLERHLIAEYQSSRKAGLGS